MPTLRGMRVDAAQEALAEANLVFGDATQKFNEKVAEGVVLAADPATGTELKRDAAVDLLVSQRPAADQGPRLHRQGRRRGREGADRPGFQVGDHPGNDDTVPEGDVISQSPDRGTLFRGDTVELTVSKGPVMVEVPKVQGVGVAEATARMEAAGFEVRTERSDVYVGLEFVVKSDPAQGSMAPEGSTVTLFLV